jgi:hypothetical protein
MIDALTCCTYCLFRGQDQDHALFFSLLFPYHFSRCLLRHHLMEKRWTWSWRQTFPVTLIGSVFALATGAMIYIGAYRYTGPLFESS